MQAESRKFWFLPDLGPGCLKCYRLTFAENNRYNIRRFCQIDNR